jgi:hypothetical protein
MAKFLIYPNRPILFEGSMVTPDDVLATIETDLPVREVLALLQFRNADLRPDKATADEEDEDNVDDFKPLSKTARERLAKAGLATLAQAAVWLRDNKDFTKLGLTAAASAELTKLITDAGLPTA